MEHGETLGVRGLKTYFFTKAGTIKAVDDVSFSLRPGRYSAGRRIGLRQKRYRIFNPRAGGRTGKIVEGEILFRGEDLRSASEERRRSLRGSSIAAVFQDPLMTLNRS